MIRSALAVYLALAAAPPPAASAEIRPLLAAPQRGTVRRPPPPPPRRGKRGRRHLRLGPGGLRAHEDSFGHCCRKHVGWTPEQMFARLRRNENLIRVSTFPNMKTAQRVLRATLHQNSARLYRWQVAGNPGSMEIYGRFNYPVGTYVQRSSLRVRKAYRAYFLLVGNRHWPGGFQIVTGFPVP